MKLYYLTTHSDNQLATSHYSTAKARDRALRGWMSDHLDRGGYAPLTRLQENRHRSQPRLTGETLHAALYEAFLNQIDGSECAIRGDLDLAPPEIAIFVEGGTVQSVCADRACQVFVLDDDHVDSIAEGEIFRDAREAITARTTEQHLSGPDEVELCPLKTE